MHDFVPAPLQTTSRLSPPPNQAGAGGNDVDLVCIVRHPGNACCVSAMEREQQQQQQHGGDCKRGKIELTRVVKARVAAWLGASNNDARARSEGSVARYPRECHEAGPGRRRARIYYETNEPCVAQAWTT